MLGELLCKVEGTGGVISRTSYSEKNLWPDKSPFRGEFSAGFEIGLGFPS